MGEVQGQGYIGQALGVADVLAGCYFHALNYRPAEPEWEERDRFLLSIGHYAIALYAALIEAYPDELWADQAKGDVYRERYLREGMVAPDFETEDVDGVAFSLSDYRGGVVLIEFWGFW